MKIPLLNKILKNNDIIPVIFTLAPVEIQLTESKIAGSDQISDGSFYTTIVFCPKDCKYYILEFSQDILNGLLAYRERYKKLTNVEILLSRDEDNSMRMKTGTTNVRLNLINKDIHEEYKKAHANLLDVYQTKIGYTPYELIVRS